MPQLTIDMYMQTHIFIKTKAVTNNTHPKLFIGVQRQTRKQSSEVHQSGKDLLILTLSFHKVHTCF